MENRIPGQRWVYASQLRIGDSFMYVYQHEVRMLRVRQMFLGQDVIALDCKCLYQTVTLFLPEGEKVEICPNQRMKEFAKRNIWGARAEHFAPPVRVAGAEKFAACSLQNGDSFIPQWTTTDSRVVYHTAKYVALNKKEVVVQLESGNIERYAHGALLELDPKQLYQERVVQANTMFKPHSENDKSTRIIFAFVLGFLLHWVCSWLVSF